MDEKAFLSKLKNFSGEEFSEIINLVKEQSENAGCDMLFSFDADSLLNFNPDFETIAVALLSPIFEADLLCEKDVRERWGNEIFELLFGLKKLHQLRYEENNKSSQVDVLRKIFLTMAKDIRVILIALSQRLFIMKNLNNLYSERKKEMIARETLDVYVPIAERIGIYRLKTGLEDLSFRYLHKEQYSDILAQLESFGERREKTISYLTNRLMRFLGDCDVNAEVFGRVKSVYSIYRKIQKKNLNSLRDLFDIFAMRVVVDHGKERDTQADIEHLYRVLGKIHSKWTPIPQRFKDYVMLPKNNGYKSLHTVVLGLIEESSRQPVEIQIRTRPMHLEAEHGYASHWLYKKAGAVQSHAQWLRGLKSFQMGQNRNMDLMKKVELDIFKDRIFVLTPKGEVKDLPKGATPIDFAFNVHSGLGEKCYMAKVNDKVVPLSCELNNGDLVSIITKAQSQPKLEWLSFVKTPAARKHIKYWFRSFDKDFYVKEGKRILNAFLEKRNLPLLDQNYSILKRYKGKVLSLSLRESLLEEIGRGSKLPSDVLKKIYEAPKKEKKAKERVSQKYENSILVGGEAGLPLKLAKCCIPKSGNKIIGYVTRENHITIHRDNCRFLKTLNPERFIPAQWRDGEEV